VDRGTIRHARKRDDFNEGDAVREERPFRKRKKNDTDLTGNKTTSLKLLRGQEVFPLKENYSARKGGLRGVGKRGSIFGMIP